MVRSLITRHSGCRSAQFSAGQAYFRLMHTCFPLTSYKQTEWSSEPTTMQRWSGSLVQKAANTQCLLLEWPAPGAEQRQDLAAKIGSLFRGGNCLQWE